MPRRTIRLTADADERLQSTAKTEATPTRALSFRAAIDHELSGREDTMIGAEERLATSMDQMQSGDFSAWASPAGAVCVCGQSRQDFADLRSRAGWRGNGSRCD